MSNTVDRGIWCTPDKDSSISFILASGEVLSGSPVCIQKDPDDEQLN